jgi:transcriptional regulator with XRE-family HTH domain
MTLSFADRLRQEFARRRAANPRYSLRAFAQFLGLEHSTLSQILRGRRGVPAGTLARLAQRLDLGPEEAAAYQGAPDIREAARFAAQARRMSWLGEAAALLQTPAHWRLIDLLRSGEWRPDMRWAASRTGCSIDALNEASTRLLRLGLIRVDRQGTWRTAREIAGKNAHELREFALARIREASAT